MCGASVRYSPKLRCWVLTQIRGRSTPACCWVTHRSSTSRRHHGQPQRRNAQNVRPHYATGLGVICAGLAATTRYRPTKECRPRKDSRLVPARLCQPGMFPEITSEKPHRHTSTDHLPGRLRRAGPTLFTERCGGKSAAGMRPESRHPRVPAREQHASVSCTCPTEGRLSSRPIRRLESPETSFGHDGKKLIRSHERQRVDRPRAAASFGATRWRSRLRESGRDTLYTDAFSSARLITIRCTSDEPSPISLNRASRQ
jgi:hypothetical protein